MWLLWRPLLEWALWLIITSTSWTLQTEEKLCTCIAFVWCWTQGSHKNSIFQDIAHKMWLYPGRRTKKVNICQITHTKKFGIFDSHLCTHYLGLCPKTLFLSGFLQKKAKKHPLCSVIIFFVHFWCVYQPFSECPFKIAKRVKHYLKLVSDKWWSSLRSDQSEVFWNPLDIWSARISLDFNPRPSFLVLRIAGIKCFWRQPSISCRCSIRVGPCGFLMFNLHF